MTFEEKVKYIISRVGDYNDAFYLIKALVDKNTRECLFTKDFLDTSSAVAVRDKLFKEDE